jgi:hypothetical protein
LACSLQGFVDKYHFSKKWFYLYGEVHSGSSSSACAMMDVLHFLALQQQQQQQTGWSEQYQQPVTCPYICAAAAGALCCFAYLYMRPFVRRGLGSAHRYGGAAEGS